MKKAENSEKRPEIWRQVFRRMKNQDGASLMAALLFFVFCGVTAIVQCIALGGEDERT